MSAAVPVGSSLAIGAPVTGGTTNSVLFVGAGSDLAQDNANFAWIDASSLFRVITSIQAANSGLGSHVTLDSSAANPVVDVQIGSGGSSGRWNFFDTGFNVFFDIVADEGNGAFWDMNPGIFGVLPLFVRMNFVTVLRLHNATQSALIAAAGDAVIGLAVKANSGTQSADLQEWQDSGGGPLAAITKNGGFTPASMADTSAANSTIYYSTTANKLVFKDSGGTVNNLY